MILHMDLRRALAGAAVLFVLMPAAALAEVGALAYSPTTDHYVVLALNMISLRDVQLQALAGCTEDDCRIIQVFYPGECVSLAISDKRFGHAKAKSQEQADAWA